MEKFFPPKPPLEMILPPVIDKVLTLMGRNQYNRVALVLVAHDLDSSETAISGNLNRDGMEAILSSALNKINSEEATNDPE